MLYCAECCSDDIKGAVVDMIEFNTYEDHDVDSDPIVFLQCGHFYSMSTLDGIVELGKNTSGRALAMISNNFILCTYILVRQSIQKSWR